MCRYSWPISVSRALARNLGVVGGVHREGAIDRGSAVAPCRRMVGDQRDGEERMVEVAPETALAGDDSRRHLRNRRGGKRPVPVRGGDDGAARDRTLGRGKSTPQPQGIAQLFAIEVEAKGRFGAARRSEAGDDGRIRRDAGDGDATVKRGVGIREFGQHEHALPEEMEGIRVQLHAVEVRVIPPGLAAGCHDGRDDPIPDDDALAGAMCHGAGPRRSGRGKQLPCCRAQLHDARGVVVDASPRFGHPEFGAGTPPCVECKLDVDRAWFSIQPRREAIRDVASRGRGECRQ